MRKSFLSLAALPAVALAQGSDDQLTAGAVVPITLNGYITSVTLPYWPDQTPAPGPLIVTPPSDAQISAQMASIVAAVSSIRGYGANSPAPGWYPSFSPI